MKHTLSVLIVNDTGELARVVGLLRGKSLNIEGLCVGETLDPAVRHITVVTSGAEWSLQQITNQLGKLVAVLQTQ